MEFNTNMHRIVQRGRFDERALWVDETLLQIRRNSKRCQTESTTCHAMCIRRWNMKSMVQIPMYQIHCRPLQYLLIRFKLNARVAINYDLIVDLKLHLGWSVSISTEGNGNGEFTCCYRPILFKVCCNANDCLRMGENYENIITRTWHTQFHRSERLFRGRLFVVENSFYFNSLPVNKWVPAHIQLQILCFFFHLVNEMKKERKSFLYSRWWIQKVFGVNWIVFLPIVMMSVSTFGA